MNIQLSTNAFSKEDFELALKNLTGLKVGYITSKLMPNKCYFFQYWVWVERRWVRCQTFVSVKVLLQAKMSRLVARSKEVRFQGTFVNGFVSTTHGWQTSQEYCTCPAFSGQFSNQFAMYLNGRKVCKHTIAVAKQYFSVNSLSELVTFQAA